MNLEISIMRKDVLKGIIYNGENTLDVIRFVNQYGGEEYDVKISSKFFSSGEKLLLYYKGEHLESMTKHSLIISDIDLEKNN